MRMNNNASKREKDGKMPSDGPHSKANYDRFSEGIRQTQNMGARNIAKITQEKLYSQIILEEANNEEEIPEYETPTNLELNPLISSDALKIIDAAIPKYTMQ